VASTTALDSNFLQRLIDGGPLNVPWGITFAPPGFGLKVEHFSDGIPEAEDASCPASTSFSGQGQLFFPIPLHSICRRTASAQEFGEARLGELLSKHAAESHGDNHSTVTAAVKEWNYDSDSRDDTTLVLRRFWLRTRICGRIFQVDGTDLLRIVLRTRIDVIAGLSRAGGSNNLKIKDLTPNW
jgi:hypothetical protein